MREIGRHFDRAAWQKASEKAGEIILGADKHGKPRLETSWKGWALSVVPADRLQDTRQALTTARAAAFDELEVLLGQHGKQALDAAGLARGRPLAARQVRDALAFVDKAVFARTVDGMLADDKFLAHNTKLRDNRLRGVALEKTRPLELFTARKHVEKASGLFQEHFAAKNSSGDNAAMSLAFKMKALGRSIAGGQLNNLRAQGAVTEQLFKAHAGELQKTHSPKVLNLAKQLACRDPLMDLLRGKLGVAEATWQIRVMAEHAGTTPQRMLGLLRQQLDCELGSQSAKELTEVHHPKDQTKGGNFDFEEIELFGEMSPGAFKRLVGEDGPSFGADGLKLAAAATPKLADLTLEVAAWGDETGLTSVEPLAIEPPQQRPRAVNKDALPAAPQRPLPALPQRPIPGPPQRPLPALPRRPLSAPQEAAAKQIRALSPQQRRQIEAFDRSGGLRHAPPHEQVALPGTRGLTENQYGLLRSVRMAEAQVMAAPDPRDPQRRSPERQVLDLFQARYGIGREQAERLLEATEAWFRTAPLTITFKAADAFAEGPEPVFGTRYKAAQEIATRQLKSAEVSELVRGEGVETGLNVVSTTEPGSRGANYIRWRMEKDAIETQHRGLTRTEQATFGAVNINFEHTKGFEGSSAAYGESHLVLKPEVRERAAFNFNKTRELRAGATMLIYDMNNNRNADSRSTARLAFVDAMVHNALGLAGMRPTPLLQLEVEIFGELDMVKDVQEVRVPAKDFTPKGAKPLSDKIRENLTNFFTKKGIQVGESESSTVDAWGKNEQFKEQLDDDYKSEIQNALDNLE